MKSLPKGLLLTFYGDDFTGSSDVLQNMAAAGIETLLFLRPPTADDLAKHPHVQCVGVAGTARAQSPQWMDTHLPNMFQQLHALGAPILLYKVCSTFDSSPEIGSIGRAIDVGVATVGGDWSPMVIGAPALKRYQAFGHLFAVADGVGYRLDRHPTMSRHPVTPMHESDLALHLRAQTSRRIALIDLAQLQAGKGDARRRALSGDDTPVVLIDVIDELTLREAGRLLWDSPTHPTFSASSSGLPAALVAHWRHENLIPTASETPTAQSSEKVLVVSGSCSPATAGQIAWAHDNGFAVHRLNIPAVLNPRSREATLDALVGLAVEASAAGKSVVLYSASGPTDEAVLRFDQTAAQAGVSRHEATQQIGQGLAWVCERVLDATDVRRIVIAGGDSSGAVMQSLGVDALSFAGALEPGVPLCRAHSSHPKRDGLELALKGGQMGSPAFFEVARRGAAR